MNNFLIRQFILNLNVENGIKFAKKYGVDFTKDEAKIIVPILKKNVDLVKIETKEKLLSIIKKEVSSSTYLKAIKLLDNLL